MNKKSTLLLYLALGFAYTGEYNSLISILEHARQLGGAKNSLILYLIYTLPAFFLLIFSTLWKNRFIQFGQKLPGIYFAAALVFLLFTQAASVSGLIFCIFAVALFRQWTKILVLSFVQSRLEGTQRSTVLAHLVSLRFVVMILGATVGGYLGEKHLFSASLVFHSACYLFAGGLFYQATHSVPAALVQQKDLAPFASQSFLKQIGHGYGGVYRAFGPGLLVAFIIAYIGASAFFALEYPLLINDLGVAPSNLFLTYFGHIFGALLAGRVAASPWIDPRSGFKTYALVLLLILSYGIVGIGPHLTAWYSFQLGICAFLLPIFETHYSSALMVNAKSADYPSQALALNLLAEFTNLLGSSLPLLLIGSMNSFQANQCIQGVTILVLLLAGAVVWKLTIKSNRRQSIDA